MSWRSQNLRLARLEAEAIHITREGVTEFRNPVMLYLVFAKDRPIVERNGALIMVDDHRLPLRPSETPQMIRVGFRTLGCYPLPGAFRSQATTLDCIIAEMRQSRTSERQGRFIDHDESGSMEKKKREGYF
jgi:sulfate adenylyltransferase subunit 2